MKSNSVLLAWFENFFLFWLFVFQVSTKYFWLKIYQEYTYWSRFWQDKKFWTSYKSLHKSSSWIKTTHTDSTKINRPEHNIRMYWTNFRQPTAHVQQNIFGKTLIEVCSLNLYASFGTFCVQMGQLFASQWVFEACLKIDN